MPYRLLAAYCIVALASLTLSLIRGQERSVDAPASSPKKVANNPVVAPPVTAVSLKPIRDFSGFNELQRQLLLTAQRGADWLFRMNGLDGRFKPGLLPALARGIEDDSYARQAGAARALAQAARFWGEERYAARARQAILLLRDDTETDPNDNLSRRPRLPGSTAYRVAVSSLLVLAIHELPAPASDLLDSSNQLCRYLTRQTQSDGTFPVEPTGSDVERLAGVLAVQALCANQRHQPSAEKLAVIHKALAGLRQTWKKAPCALIGPELANAAAEAYLVGKDKGAATLALEVADWLCALQYAQIDPRHPDWYGGFRTWRDGRAMETAPDIGSARPIIALVAASRVARELGDVQRFQRYTDASESGLQFVSTLQYSTAVSQHFQEWFRSQIVGGFHASHQDGNLRIDYTQQAVSALLGYLEHVVR